MAREIKFRAWDKTEKEMFNIDELSFNSNGSVYSVKRKGFTSTGGCFTYPEKDNVVLMQFTGLHDKNGKEIYEGDINENKMVVLCGNEYGAVTLSKKYKKGKKIEEVIFNEFWEDCSLNIIGNIHENPELLTT